jgi:hypothetical protein
MFKNDAARIILFILFTCLKQRFNLTSLVPRLQGGGLTFFHQIPALIFY